MKFINNIIIVILFFVLAAYIQAGNTLISNAGLSDSIFISADSNLAFEKRGNIIYILTISYPIVPPLTDYIKDGINRAVEENAQCVIIQLNTPGGLTETMRDIAQLMLNIQIPVVVYVAPSGARAASAGVFLVYSADISAMAPATNIGSASPVNFGGKDISETMKKKVENDLIAFLESLAKIKNKNIDIAKEFVDTSINLSPEAALSKKTVDLIAVSIDELLQKINGKTLKKQNKNFKLQTEKCVLRYYDIPLYRSILIQITNPNIIYILMILGVWALIYEFVSPGFGISGAFGILCLLISFFGMQALPVTTAGILLIICGIIFFVLEAFLPTFGVVGIIGVIAFILGSFMLFNDKFFSISSSLIISTAIFSVCFILFIVGAFIKTRKIKYATGIEELIGATGIVRKELNPEGMVFYNGELWTAADVDNKIIEIDVKVKIVSFKGMKIIVERSRI